MTTKTTLQVLEDMTALIRKTYINEKGRFNPNNIAIEEATEMLRIAALAGRIGGMTLKHQIKVGDIVFIKWSDEWEYPLVVKGVGHRNIKATYVYENGKLETWTIPINNLTYIVPTSVVDIISELKNYVNENDGYAAMPENNEQFLLEVKLNRK
ncbi:hypothetical protein [Ewingella americana]|uniref:Uncharacterized protein n=1 Tax=Ewingella americana TaxID=41202 RepID=A0A502GFI8_9GAMM|nr:hypothetical protein [Ewingella americana]TPG60050.1 hypothetical protein EAH77_15905 [Ewingella americana]